MTKLEQVARAIYLSDHGCDGFPNQEDAMQQAYIAMARAAVEALREPNEAMIQRGWELIRGNLRPDEIFPHMIEVVLDEKPE